MATREQKAAELLDMLERGPSLGFVGRPLTKEEAENKTRLWLKSWIIPLAKQLVPELKVK